MGRRGEHIVVDRADQSWLTQLGLSSVRSVMRYRPGSVAAMSGTSETFAVDVDAGPDAPELIFVKRYAYRGWKARLKGMFRGTLLGTSRARFEYEFLNEMRRRGLPAVRPVAYGERRRAGFLAACFLITEGEVGAKSLDVYAGGRQGPRTEPPDERRRFIETLAHLLRRMHRAGVMHGGLYWRNILVADAGDGERRFHIIDPDRRGRLYHAEVPRPGVVSDLADFVATSASFARRTDIIRFARAYLDKSRLDEAEKGLLREIITTAARSTAQEAHRVAVGHSIEWLTKRMQQAGRGRQFDTVAAFFDHLAQAWTQGRADLDADGDACIRLVFPGGAATGATETYTVTNGGGGLTITSGRGVETTVQSGGQTEARLTVTTDADTWLAIVNGRSDAFDLIRAGRLTIAGDTKLLPFLAKSIACATVP